MATVLVVEDDKLSQRILSKMLANASHAVLLASSVAEAWRTLRQHVWVDLVILDNQLGKDWGWQFLESVRDDVLYQDLPVVVYTGHTERSSILRYVELGVKSMLVKPYKAEIVFEEVAKAEKIDWAGKLLERPESACSRLKINERDYYSVLSAGATALEKIVADIRHVLETRPDETRIRELLQQLYSQSVTLGMQALRTTTEALARGIGARNTKQIQNSLQGIDSLRTLLRTRVLAYVGIDAIAVDPKPATGSKSPVAKAADEAPASDAWQAFRRQTAATPLWKLGSAFDRLAQGRLFTADEFAAFVTQWSARPPFTAFQNVIRALMDGSSSASFESLLADLDRWPKFKASFLEIVGRLSGRFEIDGDEPQYDVGLNRLGIHKTVVLFAARQLATALPTLSGLDLSILRLHTVTTLLLAHETSRMLGLDDDLLVAAAGAAHQIGSWLFAVGEPGLYGIALARATTGAIDHVEAEIFGKSHAAASAMMLQQWNANERLVWLAENYLQPKPEGRAGQRAMAACVQLAHQLAWSTSGCDPAFAQAFHEQLLAPTHPLWRALQEDGVSLPMDIPEFVDALATAAGNSEWVSQALLRAE